MACDYKLRTDEIPGQTSIKILTVLVSPPHHLTVTQTVVAVPRKMGESDRALRNRLAGAALDMGLLACGGPDRVVPLDLVSSGFYRGEREF